MHRISPQNDVYFCNGGETDTSHARIRFVYIINLRIDRRKYYVDILIETSLDVSYFKRFQYGIGCTQKVDE